MFEKTNVKFLSLTFVSGPRVALPRTPPRVRPSVRIVAQAKRGSSRETIIPEPDYKLAGAFLALSGLAAYSEHPTTAGILGIFGIFLGVQAGTFKFVFDDEAIEVVVGSKMTKSDNVFVGGRNRWTYDSIVSWVLW